jgi:hypothetical protein
MKVTIQRKTDNHINGLMNRNNDIPEDFMATSSKLSPRFPKVIIDEIKMAIGIASISNEALAYQRN